MKKLALILSVVLSLSVFTTACGVNAPAPTSKTDSQTGDNSSSADNGKNKTEQTDKEGATSNQQADGQKDAANPSGTAEETLPPPPPKEKPLEFPYPDAVRGVYVTGHSAGGSKFAELVKLIDNTDLNAMVIDIKDDYGNITYKPEEGSPLAPYGKPFIKDPKAMLKTLSEHKIYPIARIVVFKDSVLAAKQPDYSFLYNGSIWRNNRKEAFVNPFIQGVWEHNIAVAKEAAKMGFQEIQFDYVRFPEGFEKRDTVLKYTMGQYAGEKDLVQARVKAITDFVAYAEKELKPLGVKVSVDIFGYTVTLPEAPGIGQNFTKISSNVDVISSMIYPSHWGFNNLKVPKPDLDPYQLVHNYVATEKEKLFRMEDPPLSRPWIQDFTARWLGAGNYKVYGKAEVEAQIRALNEAGIKEFLIWNAANDYTTNVDFTPALDQAKVAAIMKQDEVLRLAIIQEEEAKKAAQSGANTGTGQNGVQQPGTQQPDAQQPGTQQPGTQQPQSNGTSTSQSGETMQSN